MVCLLIVQEIPSTVVCRMLVWLGLQRHWYWANDSLTLNSSGSVVDTVSYDRFLGNIQWGEFKSLSSGNDETDNDTARFWCSEQRVYGDGDYGTPKGS